MRMNETVTVNNTHCGGTWGWRRAVYLDMTDPNTNCPSGWNMTGYLRELRTNSSQLSCDSVFFPVSGGLYSQVCGRIRAYQWGVSASGGIIAVDKLQLTVPISVRL